MTDAPASSAADRYGRPAPWRRRAVVLGSGLLGALALTWLAWTTVFHANPEVSSELVGWKVVDDHVVTAQVDVAIRGDDSAEEVGAACQVRAVATDHVVVGEATYVPREGRNEVDVRTERAATSVENVGCTTPNQHRPR
jgi:Domain of unknown function (DUF4307)